MIVIITMMIIIIMIMIMIIIIIIIIITIIDIGYSALTTYNVQKRYINNCQWTCLWSI